MRQREFILGETVVVETTTPAIIVTEGLDPAA